MSHQFKSILLYTVFVAFFFLGPCQGAFNAPNGVPCNMTDPQSEPKTPFIQSTDAQGSTTIVSVGARFNVECFGYIGASGKLEFYTRDVATNATTVITTPFEEYREDGQFDQGQTCNMFAQARLSLPISMALDGKALSCVTGVLSTTPVCSNMDKFCVEVTVFDVQDVSPGGPDMMILIVLGTALFIVVVLIAVLLKAAFCKKNYDAGKEGSIPEKPPSEHEPEPEPETAPETGGEHADGGTEGGDEKSSTVDPNAAPSELGALESEAGAE